MSEIQEKMLPERPNLDQLRQQAKQLRDAARAGDAAALERINASLPGCAPGALATTQLVIAREYGFDSWPALVAEVDARTMGRAELAEAFVRASVSGRTTDRAAALLRADPTTATHDIFTGGVLGEVTHVRRLIEHDSSAATRPDDRSGWPPLLAVCMSRWHHIDPSRAAGMLAVARLLLAAGADPNTAIGPAQGRSGHCSALFAAAGAAHNPAITALLLEQGASAEDHTYYLAGFDQTHECLRLLLEHRGVPANGTALAAPISGGDTEGARLLLAAGADPRRLLPLDAFGEAYIGQPSIPPVYAAVRFHGDAELVELLLTHGGDPVAAGPDGRSPYRLARRQGKTGIAELLVRYGARDDATDVDRFLGACRRADRVEAERLLGADPNLRDRLTDDDRSTIVQAAEYGDADAVRLMLDLGFPPDARDDIHGATALHIAANAGSVEVVRLLLDHGAELDARDSTWGGPPIVWATIGSGERLGHNPNPDWVGTIQTLIDAGASPDAWLEDRPPSPEVIELLRAHGICGPTERE